MQASSSQNLAHSRERPFSTSFAEAVDPVNPPFQHFDEEALFVSLEERVEYLRAFLNFTHEDVETLNDIVSTRNICFVGFWKPHVQFIGASIGTPGRGISGSSLRSSFCFRRNQICLHAEARR